MMRKKKIFFYLTLSFAAFYSFTISYAEEEITITTYYPSPYGSYRELTAHRMKIGRTYSGSGVTVNDDNLIVEGTVGIGTTAPTQKLDVAGYVKGQSGLCIGDDCRDSWSPIETTIETMVVSKSAPCDGTTVATCPDGYKLLGGGNATWETRTCNRENGAIHWIVSMPDGNGWRCGSDDYCATCYAICGK